MWITSRRSNPRVKTVVLLVSVSVVLVSGYVSHGRKPEAAYIPPTPKESFFIGAFQPNKADHKANHYDGTKATDFLASISGRFSDGDIVAVDGLKWKRTPGGWAPIPNPPIPVFKQGDNMNAYLRRYAEWINNHPHFGYAPLPLGNKE